MAISCTCPGCATPFDAPEELAGKRVKCSQCMIVFNVPALASRAAAADELPVVKQVAAPLNDLFRESERSEPLRRASKRGSRDDDRDDNRSRNRDRDRDEPQPRRAKGSRSRGSALPWVLGLGGAALVLFLLCGGGIAVVAVVGLTSKKANPQVPIAAVNPPLAKPPQGNVLKPPPKGNPPAGNNPIVQPEGVNLPPGAPPRAMRVTQFNGNLQVQSRLTAADPLYSQGQNAPFNNNKRCKEYVIEFIAGRQYVIDLESRDFDAFLLLEEVDGRFIADNDDIAPGNLNSRIFFTPNVTGPYVIVATSLDARLGAFNFMVRDTTQGGFK